MFWIIVGMIIFVPILELWGLITVGNYIGPVPTLMLVLTTAVLGSYLARREGIQTYKLAMIQLRNGEIPGEALLDGALILTGGILLIIPGFFTDIAGIILVLPYTRGIVKLLLKRWLDKKIKSGIIHIYRRK